ncbi:MAG: hypothetical protein Q9227_000954 [Pyrenula ochraceoflavens]
METQVNKPHRKAKAKKKVQDGPNPKAFAFSRPGRLQKQAVRSHEVKEKRLHVPLVDRLPEEAPPIVVAVVGPPGVGKTTLIKSLIKRYSKQTLSSPTGPLTIVTSKKRRLTFLECPSESLAAMIDVAKIADIVLLMIDGNYGFEMETMEFLNALQASGMPGNVFGILTHLDLFRKQSTLKQAKKRLKHRFWSELYQGAKLFYLSGVINGRYPDREIHNLSRFLSVMKNPRPLVWRNSHPYCLADRFLDITPPTTVEENPKCDRTIALYGYLRGTNFPATNARVHVPGVGDQTVTSIEALPDPCPTPFAEQAMARATGKTPRRRLGEKQKVLFAPMSDVGGVLVDKDAVYIDVKTSTFDREAENVEDRGLGEQMMLGLQGERRLLGDAESGVRLFQGGDAIDRLQNEKNLAQDGRKEKRRVHFLNRDEGDEQNLDEDEEFESGSISDDDVDNEAFLTGEEESDFDDDEPLPPISWDNKNKDVVVQDSDVAFADSDSDLGSVSSDDGQSLDGQQLDDTPIEDGSGEDEEEETDLRWKENLSHNVQRLNGPRYRAADLARMLYDNSLTPAQVITRWRGEDTAKSMDNGNLDNMADNEEDFFQKKSSAGDADLEDRMTPAYDHGQLARKWQDVDVVESLRLRFAKTSMKSRKGLEGDSEDMSGSDSIEEGEEDGFEDDDEGDGVFEDLETGDKVTSNPVTNGQAEIDINADRERNARRKEELRLRFEDEDREGFANNVNEGREHQQEFGEDDWYDAQKAQIQKQLGINKTELDNLDPVSRARAEGFKAGTYARLVLENVPCEFAAMFNPRYPVIIGGLAPTEDRFGFVQIRIKRHRWHKKILKTNDPLIFSLGWRRFQTIPIYSLSDSRTRNRMLKYSPEHMHCFGTFYGPLVAPNTGFCCVQSFSNKNSGFRIAATGVVLNVDEGTEIVKKLKLTGNPYKIFRNTAFIRDMFNSSIEIAKFEGASIRTVSGIRGQIKRALSKPEGHFRATFEDKILMSDLVFLRAWYPVRPHRFYNPVTNLLDVTDPENAGEGWNGMRLTGEIRHAQGIPTPQERDSRYTPINRPTRHFNPLRVPRNLAKDLPFKSQITQMKSRKVPSYVQKRAVVLGGEEKKARDLMQKLMTMRNEKATKRAAAQEERRKVHRTKVAEGLDKKEAREKREKEEFWRKEGKKRKTWNTGEEAGGGGKRRKKG